MAMGKKRPNPMFAPARAADEYAEGGESSEFGPKAPPPPPGWVPGTGDRPMAVPDDTLRDVLVGLMQKPVDAFTPHGPEARGYADKLTTLAEFNPVVGGVTSAGDFYDAAKRGDKSDMAWAAAFMGLNALGVKPMARALKGAMRGRTYPWGEGDFTRPKVK